MLNDSSTVNTDGDVGLVLDWAHDIDRDYAAGSAILGAFRETLHAYNTLKAFDPSNAALDQVKSSLDSLYTAALSVRDQESDDDGDDDPSCWCNLCVQNDFEYFDTESLVTSEIWKEIWEPHLTGGSKDHLLAVAACKVSTTKDGNINPSVPERVVLQVLMLSTRGVGFVDEREYAIYDDGLPMSTFDDGTPAPFSTSSGIRIEDVDVDGVNPYNRLVRGLTSRYDG